MQHPIISKQPNLFLFCKPATQKVILFISVLVTIQSFAQTHSTTVSPGAFYTRYGKNTFGYTNAFIPYVSVASGKYYTELRYNYDYDNTFGAYIGKTYYIDKDSTESLIPQVGWLWKGINAGSTQLYYTLEKKKLSIEFENQYSFTSRKNKNIYYNWLTAGYKVNPVFSAGVSEQLYIGPGKNYNDNGVFICFHKAGYVISLYDFNAYNLHRHYVAIELINESIFGSRKK